MMPRTIPALIVHQWLEMWNNVQFSPDERRRKPDPHFYVFSMSANTLRRSSNIYRRQTNQPRAEDLQIQRRHMPERSNNIRKFIKGGFPWSDLSERRQNSSEYQDLQMPGWLPTAIIVNILAPGTQRGRMTISDCDLIRVELTNDRTARLILPDMVDAAGWRPDVAPLEIIDGQHRLLAFAGDRPPDGNYELPVVAFYDLDITWQAYLFYMINIKPKRIDPSLAFDLYPILRVQEWLEKSPETAKIYRETRAQELTEVLWSHSRSPWRNRISMLGERKRGTVTQSAFIRSLMASYIKGGRGNTPGGLFGARIADNSASELDWDRAQQAAFLILVWSVVAEAVRSSREVWAENLREFPLQEELPLSGDAQELDPAFTSRYSLLTTDQGVRGVLQVTNDMCYVSAARLKLADWEWHGDLGEGTISEETVQQALDSLYGQAVLGFLESIAAELATFDWRTSATPGLDDDQRKAQMIFRGSGGYTELRRQLALLLAEASDPDVRQAATLIS